MEVNSEFSMKDLKDLATKLLLRHRKSKKQMILDINSALKEYEEYKKEKVDRYKKISQLGDPGKEGTTFLVTHGNVEYAMKCFRKTKSSKTLKKEFTFLKQAGKLNISPKAIDYDTVSKYIVMEKMDSHLYSEIQKKGKLKKAHQLRILEIFSALDKLKIFHNDANLMNYMLKDGVVYMIDFGFAKEVTPKLTKKLGTDQPNSHLMTVGLIKKLQELKITRNGEPVLLEPNSYRYLVKSLPKDFREKYGIK